MSDVTWVARVVGVVRSDYPFATVRVVAAVAAAVVVALAAAVVVPAVVTRASGFGDPATFELPAVTGATSIGTFDLHLRDPSRTGTGRRSSADRELMVSVWYPAEHLPGAPATPYLPRRIASFYDQSSAELGISRGDVDFMGARTHAQTRVPAARGLGPRPVILYLPGGGMPRMLATSLVEDLVSHSYVVVTVDHPGQAPIEFPDRTQGVDPELALADALADRVADVSFVLDQLALVSEGGDPDVEQRSMPAGVRELLDLDHVGMFGHSIGGFAAAQAMITDPRIDAGANLDGSMLNTIGEASVLGVDRPFLLMGAGVDGDSRRPHHHRGSPDWAAFWAASTGWKRDIYLPAGEHSSFTDLQSVLPQLRTQIDLDEDAVRTDAIGTVAPESALGAERAYLRAFFDLHLLGEPQSLFDPGSRSPFPVAEMIS